MKTFLTPNDIKGMVKQSQCLRDQVMLSFYADTGCRVSELLAIAVEHIDIDQCQAMIPHLKTGIRKKCPKCRRPAGRRQAFCSRCGQNLSGVKAEGTQERNRLISFSQETADLLKVYMRGMDPKEKLIDLTRQAVYHIIRDAADRAGLGGRLLLNPDTGKKHFVSPHKFRDSLAVSWLNFAGADANKQKALQEHLGHQNFTTTMRYNKIAPGDVKSVFEEMRKVRFGK